MENKEQSNIEKLIAWLNGEIVFRHELQDINRDESDTTKILELEKVLEKIKLIYGVSDEFIKNCGID